MTRRYVFSCERCGLCCREPGFVFFSRRDVDNASKILKISPDAFRKKYLKRIQGSLAVEVTADSPCVFLLDSHCVINDGKPTQCATFPFWSEYTNERGELVRFDRPCPGVKPEAPFHPDLPPR